MAAEEEADELDENPVRVVKLEAPPVPDAPLVVGEAPPPPEEVAAAPVNVFEDTSSPVAADANDMLAFFAEATEESTSSPVLRAAIEVVSAQELLEEARALRALIGGSC